MTTDLILTLLLFAPCILVIVTELCFVEAYDPESPRSISEIMNEADMIEERIERRERKKTMTLNEYIATNGNKTVEIQDNGTIRVLEDKGPWKPEIGEHYYTVSDMGSLTHLRWDDDRIDNKRMDIGDVFRTNAEAERALHSLRARKKFLDVGGHEGLEGYGEFREYTHKPMFGVFLQIDGTLVVHELNGISTFMIWFESREDCQRAIDSLTEEEVKALCWTGEKE